MDPNADPKKVLFRSTEGIVLRWRNAIVQYRNGEFDKRLFSVAVDATPSDDGRPVAMLTVLGPEAQTPDLLSRMHQRRVLKDMLERIDGYSAVVIEETRSEDGLPLSSRLVTQASDRMKFLTSVSEATSWLSEQTKRGTEIEVLWTRIVTDETIYQVG